MDAFVRAVRALRRSLETSLNPRRRMAVTRLTQYLNKPVALPMRQMRQRLQDMFEIKRFRRHPPDRSRTVYSDRLLGAQFHR